MYYPSDLNPYDTHHPIYFYRLQMMFQKLCFTSVDLENPIVISSSELTTTFEKYDNVFLKERVGFPNYKEVYLRIRNRLLEKTGYDIAGVKETKAK